MPLVSRPFRVLLASAMALGGCAADGSSCTVEANADGSATIRCDDGTEATVDRGEDGTSGMDGVSCTVRDGASGTHVIECDDGTTVTVTDGDDGDDGDTGPDGPPGTNALVVGPGLVVDLREAGVAADRRPFAVVRFTDFDERPLDRAGVRTLGAVSANFTVAHLRIEARVDGDVVLPYQSYITRNVMSADGMTSATQPATDSGGTWSDVDAADGVFRYDFGTILPEGYDVAATHTIGLYATRTFEGTRFVSNDVASFRPDGMEVTVTREIVTNDACNRCHSPISAHGGAREDVRLCTTCHATGYADPDTGTSIDFENMIHRIHRGASLPSVADGDVPYRIIGFGSRTHDYSHVEFPRDVRECTLCHQGPDADRWKTVPSRAACGSCHDQIWFEEGDPPEPWMELHPGGDRPDDGRCTVCHEPTGGLAPITEGHHTRLQALDALTLDFVLHGVSLDASRYPVIDFTVTVDGVGRDIVATPLPRFTFTVAGPTVEYEFFVSYTPSSTGTLTAIDAAAGHFHYTLPATVDEIALSQGVEAAGTWAFAVEGSVSSASSQSYAGPNAIAHLVLTGTQAVLRREVVDVERCNGCHEELAMHGGARNDPKYCVMCHNPRFDTIGRMPAPAAGMTAETTSVSFAHMVHRVHTGESGESDFTLWSFRGAPITFDELRYPADRRVCDKCHVDEDSYDLPTRARLPVRTRTIDSARSVLAESFIPADTWACTGCHDSDTTMAHAETMTSAMGVEACATCHASGSSLGVDVVHGRPEYDLRP